jgi:hypothetical protein
VPGGKPSRKPRRLARRRLQRILPGRARTPAARCSRRERRWHGIGAVAAAALIVVVLLDAFAAMILPRRVKHVYLARLFTAEQPVRPVLMTALAMVIGMLPSSLGLGEGGEQNAPLGRAVIGGLAFATVFTLFFVPVMYSLLRRQPPAPELAEETDRSQQEHSTREGRKGQLLAVISAPDVDDQLAQAKANLAQAKANLRLAEANAALARITLSRDLRSRPGSGSPWNGSTWTGPRSGPRRRRSRPRAPVSRSTRPACSATRTCKGSRRSAPPSRASSRRGTWTPAT